MPLQSGLWGGSSLLLACRHVGSVLPVGSSHHLIEYASLSLLTVLIQSHHGDGLRTWEPPQSLPANRHAHHVGERGGRCLDVIGCHAVDTVDMR